ncbi:hypothetical protein M404DRAFT_993239 [Pisolithus tinctorius Marx 270]|uniref:Uncharacterized protein n=1 Tax=Pisolithus tinctorius Marx 270 TaxID=870435 RepID=A0A0C3PI00_PISTI|nr:hypothetical protein M404DRAFT_993239 [Pisolithus tinctorius Marx 270]
MGSPYVHCDLFDFFLCTSRSACHTVERAAQLSISGHEQHWECAYRRYANFDLFAMHRGPSTHVGPYVVMELPANLILKASSRFGLCVVVI